MNWKSAYLETRVLSANPVELISILYEYAVLSVQDARTALADKDIAARSKAIMKAIAIIGELDTSLDHSQGGEIAENLTRLYDYMRQRLTTANLLQQDAPLEEVESLLKTLGEAWQTIAQQKRQEMTEQQHPVATGGWNHMQMSPGAMMEAVPEFCAHSWSA